MIDDKAYERSIGVDAKEALKIKIDSVRKSLGIEDMADVELLVDVLYKHQEKHEKKLEEERKKMEEEDESSTPGEIQTHNLFFTRHELYCCASTTDNCRKIYWFYCSPLAK